ncbi:helix-turn-helix domain-containing protein [Fictibacillus nanhaiensis]|uniref:helix-turn-helix domain-containing protein n=1 Tax=Fictibacillus nanhaiensis TaxID=742169 RepID=UPI001C9523BD|nr:helix-turn-helix domain-containing protein [Fictibacillus nanhaiensis]MBY6035657.1 helix-turn-helix domain-containing protein [Fictibacillus nanhaiensis]
MEICIPLVVDVLDKINGSRKSSGIYYILSGKKTSQSLSDSQWFGIQPYYAALKGITTEEFNVLLLRINSMDLIEEQEENVFVVTENGQSLLLDEKKRMGFMEKLDGLKYASIEQSCWRIITLYTQALSNALYGHNDYSPIVRDRNTVDKVKSLFPRSEQKRKEIAQQLFFEISFILKETDTRSASIFVRKLSGYDRIGNTFEQLAKEWSLDKTEVTLRFRSILHHCLRLSRDHSKQFPVLHSLIGSYTEVPALTKSASLTYELLTKDKTIQEIMRIRKLKSSTLEDHLVEIARAIPEFSIYPYIKKEDTDQVVCFYNKTKENKLRPIKEAFPHLSYLQIRLVLAKEGGKIATGSSA